MLRVGTDCSGIEAPLVALQRLGVPYEHVFSSEICATTRKQLLANHAPQILYTDATARDNSQTPIVDLYVAGWPCQGNSKLGKQKGLADPRTRVVRSLLEYITTKRPRIVLLENVANALYIDGGNQFQEVRASLQDAGYLVHFRIVCPKDVGVPMRRGRLYIVAVREELQIDFVWPTAQAVGRSLLDYVGPPPPGAHTIRPSIGPLGGRRCLDNWVAHSEILQERGEKLDEPWVATLHESMRFSSCFKGEFPCLTTRSKPWLFSHGRFVTIAECARLMGFDSDMKICVSDSQFRSMLGNSMSVDVLQAILGALMPVLRPDAPLS